MGPPWARLGLAAGALLCAGLAAYTGWLVWDGLATGSISGKYGPIPQSRRPVTYLIAIALTTLASVIWSAFALVLGVLAARRRGDGPR